MAFLASSLPVLAGAKGAFMRVSPLKAGHSKRIECNNNPVNFIDPLGLLEEIGGGEFYFLELDEGTLNEIYDAIVGYLRTDAGTYIKAWKNKSGNPKVDTDCHGLTFTRGKYWLNDKDNKDGFSQIEAILRDEYLKVPDGKLPLPGDVAIFRNSEGDIVHSATVMVGGENPWLYEISGQQTDPKFQPLGISSNFPPVFYHRHSSYLRP